MAFSSAFASGFSVGDAIKKRKREDEEKEAIRQAMEAKPVSSVVQQPTYEGMTGSLDQQDIPTRPQTVTEFMGKTVDGTMTEAQTNAARNQAVLDVIKKSDPIRAMQMEQQIRRDERADRAAERAEKREIKSDEYEQARADAFKNSRIGAQQIEYQKASEQYQQRLAKYEADKAAGKSGPELGLPPAAPPKPKYEIGDRLSDMATMFEVDAKYGKVDMGKVAQFGEALDKLKSEGYGQALKIAQAGGTIDEVAKAFNASGQGRFDPKSVVSDEIVKSKNAPPSRVIKYRDEQGALRTINTLAELDSLDKADKVFNRFFQQSQDRRADEQLQISRSTQGAAAAERAQNRKDKETKAAAAVAIYKERNPGATNAELEAVRQGILDAVPDTQKDSFDVRANELGTKVTAANKRTGEFTITDTATGETKKFAPSKPAASQGMPKSEAEAQSQARAAVSQGASKEAVNERLKQMGFKPI